MRYLPLFADVAGRKSLVIGGNENAARKLRLLLRAGTRPVVLATSVTDEIEALETEGKLHLDFTSNTSPGNKNYRLSDYALIIVADADEHIAQAWAIAARDACVPVNVVDRPDLSTVVFPGIVDRDPVIVAIGSAGAAPVLVGRLRAQIEALLPARIGRLAKFAQRFRPAVAGMSASGNARWFWERFFSSTLASLVLAGQEREANDTMLRLINRVDDSQPPAGSVSLVGVGPGDPDLVTLRALRVMQDADVVVYDRLIGHEILDYVRRDAERIYVGKARGNHAMSQEKINDLLVTRALAGQRVVRLKGGDPFVFGRGGQEMAAVQDAGISVEIVPGITAATGCAAAAGLPLTHRDFASSVTFVTGHLRDEAAKPDWQNLARTRHTLVIYMGIANAAQISQELIVHGMAPATPIAIIENGTRPEQIVARGTLASLVSTIAVNEIVGPALIVIGDVATLAQECTPVASPAYAQA